MNALTQKPIRQIAYLVEDLDASVRHWAAGMGVGPWTLFRGTAMQGRYRGEDTRVVIDVGLSYRGELQIELIQVRSRTPSPYQHANGRPRLGLHHIAWHSDDLDADLAAARARGLQPVFEAGNGAVRVAYLESPAEPGLLLEYIEATPAVSDGFAAGVVAARDWDRREPILHAIDLGA
ncbi:VOC family protein [Solimonas variicoloris]|uniref:VOC family protein n=1 Tax=Solimonas variicoloris TaxID=254408 RepID=UPI00035EA427|nr:VOC family protein [Solimonas variicoloris]